jgi:hypothetical protein
VLENPKYLRLLSLIYGLRYGDFASPIYSHPKVVRQRDASSLNIYRMLLRVLSLGAQVLRGLVFCSMIFQKSGSENVQDLGISRVRESDETEMLKFLTQMAMKQHASELLFCVQIHAH